MLKPGGIIGNVNYLGEGDYVKVLELNGDVEWVTNRFFGLENVKPALMLMKDKPRDLTQFK